MWDFPLPAVSRLGLWTVAVCCQSVSFVDGMGMEFRNQ